MSSVVRRIALALLLALTACIVAQAHGGGLDANGGHHDRKNGGYHYHGGGGSSSGGGSSKTVATSLYSANSSGRVEADVTPGRSAGELASVEISTDDELESGTFRVEKRDDGAYALRYVAEDEDGRTSVVFIVEPEGVEEFADLLGQLVD